ncbi:hypothetical protein KsCSTR_46000 [Candidatus Kuenenia stuttgartiensis]|uniref:Uncharacterized protein n=1 Tax=Kuenenia stuttgartiensis TaxID=174633 RepID=Q1PWE1_KUEST|nr:hypothetical protein KsCSTR_46000 [Candidatus Kuenenia stuttgartiensis]CAJ71539.1 unknown protein [Candidatus Kuenenia stuttgartiensis]
MSIEHFSLSAEFGLVIRRCFVIGHWSIAGTWCSVFLRFFNLYNREHSRFFVTVNDGVRTKQPCQG